MRRIDTGLYRLDDPDLPTTYLLHSPAAQNILTDQSMAGNPLKQSAIEAACDFLRAAHPLVLKGEKPAHICEFVLLSGGNYYGLKEAFDRVFSRALRQAYVGVKRYRRDDGVWDARSTYDAFDALPDNATILIGDTIATGSSLRKALSILADEYSSRSMTIKQIVVFSICGSFSGGKVLASLETQLRKTWPELAITYFTAEALFGVEKNGTDMPFFHPKTAIIPEMKETLKAHPAVASRIKCAIFDWGDRCKNPAAHYEEIASYLTALIADEKDHAILAELQAMQTRAQTALEKSHQAL